MDLADANELPAAKKIAQVVEMFEARADKPFSSTKEGLANLVGATEKDDPRRSENMIEEGKAGLDEFAEHEKKLEHSDPLGRQDVRKIQSFLLVGFAANVIIALALLLFLSVSINKRLFKIIANSKRLLARAVMVKPGAGTDEISDIDKTLYQTAARLFSLEKFKDELVSIVSHDLRTPLCSVQGVLSAVSEGILGPLPPDLIKEVATTETETERLVGFVNDLLAAEQLKASSGDFSSL